MENQEEKILWIYEVGQRDCSRWNSREDYASYELLDKEPLTEADASELLWEHQQNVADSYGEPEVELCETCQGSGEHNGTECGDCSGEGGWNEDYSEFVEKNSYSKLERYDPELHYMVSTGFPENLAYESKRKLEALERDISNGEREIAQLQKELARIGAQIAVKKSALTNDRLELLKMENE